MSDFEGKTPPFPSIAARTPDRPRRRDIVITAGLGLSILIVLLSVGVIDLLPFLASAAALSALAFVYLLTAITSAQPLPARAPVPAHKSGGDSLADAMLDRLETPVLLIGPGGRIERANPAARAFLGLANEGALLSTVLRQPSILEAVSAALRGESGSTVEYATLSPHESHVRAFVEPIKIETDGALPWRAMLCLSDETSAKRAERMRADFLANASHELRTPLASLAGFIDTLRGPAREDAKAQERFLSIMSDQTDRMRRLIDDLLSLSRVEMNEHILPDTQVDIAQVASEVVMALEPVAQNRQMAIELIAPPEDERVLIHGDVDQVHEVIENLTQNALKYSHEGQRVVVEVLSSLSRDASEHLPERISEASARLTIAAPALDSQARYGVIRVRDEGDGIDRRYLPRLSERFYRVDGQKSGPKAGTGLGLAIVKHIVTRHRGGFTVESAPGVGSVFTVFFPLDQRSAKSAAAE